MTFPYTHAIFRKEIVEERYRMKTGKYVDIHCHILPGVDDGAPDLDAALQMLKQEAQEGVGKIILTPHQKPEHWCVTAGGIEKRLGRLQKEAENLGIPVRLYPGAELMYCRGMRELLDAGKVCTLAHSRYVLVEFMPAEEWNYIRNGIYDLAGGGYWPVLAHVERYMQLADRPERVQELIEMGTYIQMNAGSVAGTEGGRIRRSCMKLLQQQLVHFMGTDAHRAEGNRSPQLEACVRLLKKQLGEAYVRRLLWKNAENILGNIQL